MGAIEALCKKGIVLENGQIVFTGLASQAIDSYLSSSNNTYVIDSKIIDGVKNLHPSIKLNSIVINGSESNIISIDQKNPKLDIIIEGELFSSKKFSLGLTLFDHRDMKLAIFSPGHVKGINYKLNEGYFKIEEQVHFPKNITKGEYRLDIGLHEPNIEVYFNITNHVKLIFPGVVGKTGLEFDYNGSGFLILE
jgi:lipopolysaccharide transport system ATP-binding protein